MQRITLDNFRVFGTPAAFDLASVTVLTGKNNSGKSSLIKAFLVLADYLEQDDQTVLRLDGPRAGKHKISTFDQLANWSNENKGKSVQLGYTKGQYEFLYEFDLGEDKAQVTASLKQFTMRATPLNSELVLTRNARLGGYYGLSVNQQFIDYMTDEQGREVTRTYLTSVGDEERLAWLQAELEEVTATLKQTFGDWAHEAQRQNWMNNPHDADFMDLATKKQKLEAQVKSMQQFTKRQITALPYQPQIQLAAIDGGTPTLSRIVQHGLLKYIEEDSIRAKKQFKFGKGGERKVLVEFIQRMGHIMQFQPDHLGPNRTYQSRLVGGMISEGEIAKVAREYVRSRAERGERAQAFLAHWLNKFGIANSVEVSELQGSAYLIAVRRKGSKDPINLADLGFGSGQLLCILLMIAANIQRKEQGVAERFLSFQHSILLLIEEPEANLHPNLQSLLAELFLETAQQQGFQIILETHSEYLIRKMQLLVGSKQIDSTQVELYYLEEESQRHIFIQPDGKLSEPFGTGFLDEAGEEALALLRIQRQAQRAQQL
jgi:predicted ATPase